MGKGERVSGAWLLSLAAQMCPSFSLLPLEGGKKRGGGWPRETVLPHSGKPTPPRFARLPLPEEGARMIFKEALIQSLPFPVRDSRFSHICRAVPLSSSVFHTACALSAPAGHLPLEGKADGTRIPSSKKAGKAATFIPNFSFLISYSSKAFIQGQGTTPYGPPTPSIGSPRTAPYSPSRIS